MATVIKGKIYKLIDEELDAANKRFGLNHSDHESFAVIREEIDEAGEDMAMIEELAARLWKNTKSNKGSEIMRGSYEDVYFAAVELAVEAVQIAAMARKGILSNIEITQEAGESAGEYADAPTLQSAT